MDSTDLKATFHPEIRHAGYTPALAACLVVGLLAGCSVTGPRSSPLPQDGKTVVEVYKEHMRTEGVGAGAAEPRERLHDKKSEVPGALLSERASQAQGQRAVGEPAGPRPVSATYISQVQPLQQRFQRLPNPDLVMYVHPHLAKGRYPVPGYLTVFPMYETVEYAMPGEVAPTRAAMAELPVIRNALGLDFEAMTRAEPANPQTAQTAQAPSAGQIRAGDGRVATDGAEQGRTERANRAGMR